MTTSAGRLDNFTDAAFAFAVRVPSFARFGPFAAFACSTLPVSIGLVMSRYDWTGGAAEE